jgi:hypothetical protein
VNKTGISAQTQVEMTYLDKVGRVTIVINTARVEARPSTLGAQARD